MYGHFFLTAVIKVPDDGSDEPNDIAHCCIALKCCVWGYSLFVLQWNDVVAHGQLHAMYPAHLTLNDLTSICPMCKQIISLDITQFSSPCNHFHLLGFKCSP